MHENEVVTIASNYSTAETMSRLEQQLHAKGIRIFAVVDHSGEAEKAGLRMPDTKLIIFGSPKAGTPLMLAAPTIALDLPLKILIHEDSEGKVLISYNSAQFLSERHSLPGELVLPMAGVAALAQAIAH